MCLQILNVCRKGTGFGRTCGWLSVILKYFCRISILRVIPYQSVTTNSGNIHYYKIILLCQGFLWRLNSTVTSLIVHKKQAHRSNWHIKIIDIYVVVRNLEHPLCQSIEINNNKYVFRQSQVRMPNGSGVRWAEFLLIIGTGCRVQVFCLILDSSVGLSAGIQSAEDWVSETLWVRILLSAEEDNLSPFDSKIACLCQSIEINNNKYVYRQSQVRMPNGSGVRWAECLLIIGTGCRVQVFSLILDSSVGLSAGIQSAGE